MSLEGSCATERPSRRAFVAAFICTAVAPAPVMAAVAAASASDDERFMRMALAEARRADFPFGAVIVRNGRVLARGRNMGRRLRDPTAHGEMVAIRRCVALHGGAVLRGSTVYTTGEPCAMCMGAILWCGVSRLVFAAAVDQLGSKIDQIALSSEDVAAKAKFAPISITGGVLADEAMKLFEK